jgi:ABC-type glutathione transport system ATPase component
LPHSVTVGSRGYKRHCPGNQQSERHFVHGQWAPRVYTLFVENGAGIAVETVGLERVYGEGPNAVRALGNVSLAFPNGEFAAIMGPSWSGKSTLLHILGALDKPTSGRVVNETIDPDQDEILERIKTLESDG